MAVAARRECGSPVCAGRGERCFRGPGSPGEGWGGACRAAAMLRVFTCAPSCQAPADPEGRGSAGLAAWLGRLCPSPPAAGRPSVLLISVKLQALDARRGESRKAFY